MLKISDFFLDKQKSFIPKKILSVLCTIDSTFLSQKMATWRPNFPHQRLCGEVQKTRETVLYQKWTRNAHWIKSCYVHIARKGLASFFINQGSIRSLTILWPKIRLQRPIAKLDNGVRDDLQRPKTPLELQLQFLEILSPLKQG